LISDKVEKVKMKLEKVVGFKDFESALERAKT